MAFFSQYMALLYLFLYFEPSYDTKKLVTSLWLQLAKNMLSNSKVKVKNHGQIGLKLVNFAWKLVSTVYKMVKLIIW